VAGYRDFTPTTPVQFWYGVPSIKGYSSAVRALAL
jgi:hypothetical protein